MAVTACPTENVAASPWPSASACCYSSTKDVLILPVVVAPSELSHVKRQILGRHVMEAAHDAALQQGPEAINGLGVDQSAHVFALAVTYGLVNVVGRQPEVAAVLVRGDETHLVGNRLADEVPHRVHVGLAQHASHDVALTLNGTNDDLLADAAGSDDLLIPMPVPVLAADVGLINLDNAHQLAEVGINHRSADTHAHVMCGLVAAEPHHPMNLQGANALLAGQDQVDHLEPLTERLVGVLKHGASDNREAVTASLSALRALPRERAISYRRDLGIDAAWARHTIGPAPITEIRLAGVVIGERRLELGDGHLPSEPDFAHRSDSLPNGEEYATFCGLSQVPHNRPGKWGNPFPVWQMHGGWWVVERDMSKGTLRFETENEARAEAVRLFRATLTEAEKFEIRRDLRGKNLACFCSLDGPCHASVLLAIANG